MAWLGVDIIKREGRNGEVREIEMNEGIGMSLVHLQQYLYFVLGTLGEKRNGRRRDRREMNSACWRC